MKDRIKKYMDYKSISAGELSSLIDVQRSNISHILNGRNKPGASFIEKLLLNFPDLNARWLFTGEGDMIENGGEQEIAPDIDMSKVSSTNSSSAQIVNEDKDKGGKLFTTTDKPIERVVLLYKDGTFTDFNRK
jgi:transcriptional regulator with XRE-family HTH domain